MIGFAGSDEKCNWLTNELKFDYAFNYKKISLDEAVELIKRNSRRYAKRQMTWFTKDKEISWFSPDDKDEIFAFVKKKLVE